MGINEKLEAWAKSPAGQKKLQAAQKKAVKAGKAFGSIQDQEKLAAYYGDRLISILDRHITAAGYEFADYLGVVRTGFDESSGQFEVHINFDPDEIRRPSLYEDGYSEGVYDIVALLNRGYRAEDHVYGQWHGAAVKSLQARDGLHFLEAAVDEFNQRYAGVATVVLNEKYQ